MSVLYLLCAPDQECIYQWKHLCKISVLRSHWILSSFLYLFSVSTVSFFFLFFLLFFLFPWWKLSEASPSATVFIYTRLCPLLKVFLCCSTLWALSCLVSLLVTLLALTDSQVKCILRAACVCVFVTSTPPFHPTFTICHILPDSMSVVTVFWAEFYVLTGS